MATAKTSCCSSIGTDRWRLQSRFRSMTYARLPGFRDSLWRLSDHSHSIVPGGLDVTS